MERRNPFTNRKIKLGGKTHSSIRDELMISFLHGRLYYLKLINIDQEHYKQETIQLNHKIDKENEIISSTIEQINRLQSWNDYVMYDGIKYGLKKVVKTIVLDKWNMIEKKKGVVVRKLDTTVYVIPILSINVTNAVMKKIDFHSTPFL